MSVPGRTRRLGAPAAAAVLSSLTMGFRLPARAALLMALTAGMLACGAPAMAAAGPTGREFFGMQTLTFPLSASEAAVIGRGGAGTLRVSFPGTLGPAQDSLTWAPFDELMATAARARLRVLPVLLGIPGSGPRINRPRTRAQRTAWGRSVAAIARRYGRGGTFWADRRELRPSPLTAYQVWNEPNLPAYWRPATDAAGYVRLVALTRARLRAVDPKATIVLAGLPESRLGAPMLDYVRAIYAVPGSRKHFDVVALNPYSGDAGGVLTALNRVRSYMDRRGDRRTPIWITELGWATSGLRSPFTTDRAGQAALITQTFRALLAARGRLRLQRLIYFSLQDRSYGDAERPTWGARTGLFDRAGAPKPAWRAFVSITGGRPGERLRRISGYETPR